MRLSKLEIIIHVVLLLLYFTGINVEWTADWFNPSIRPKTPAPLSVIFFPIYFYVNAFYIIPKFFHFETWKAFILCSALLFIAPELIRCLLQCMSIDMPCLKMQFHSRDSLIFGAPSAFFLALNTSFIYRLTKDWFVNKSKIKALKALNEAQESKRPTAAYENIALLGELESDQLSKTLKIQMEEQEIFLNPNLSLKELADLIGTTEKKLSYLLNQKMDTNFYELLNKYRVEKFESAIKTGQHEQLSLLGIAMNCGFKSKSSFYRAFKSQKACSPSEYLKKIQNPNK